jgi:hypothetical protein
MDNPDTDNIGHIRHRTKNTEEAVKNGQSRDTDNIGHIRHRTKKTEESVKNEQSRDTDNINIGYIRHRNK